MLERGMEEVLLSPLGGQTLTPELIALLALRRRRYLFRRVFLTNSNV